LGFRFSSPERRRVAQAGQGFRRGLSERVARVPQPPGQSSNAGNPKGAAQWGRLFFGNFLLAKQKKVACCRATPDDFDFGFEVTSIAQEKNYHVITAKNDSGKEKMYKTKAVIVGSGIHPRSLSIPGETALRGMGVTSCTVCDGPLYKGKTTVTIGAGNSALESALMMAGIAKKVYVVTKFPDTPETKGGFPPGENILIDKLKKLPNVEVIYGAKTVEILGKEAVSGIRYEDVVSKEQKELYVQGVMVHIGVIPNSDFITCVKKNALKEIEIDILCKTSCPGIFAAGDVQDIRYRQAITAAGSGCMAAIDAERWLGGH